MVAGAKSPPIFVPDLWTNKIKKIYQAGTFDVMFKHMQRWYEKDPEILAIVGLAGVTVTWDFEHNCWYARLRRGLAFADQLVQDSEGVEMWRLVCAGLLDVVNWEVTGAAQRSA